MNEMLSFLIGMGVTLLISTLVVVYLRPPLRRILIDLCETEDRADFWTAFTNVTIVLSPLICAMFHRPTGGSGVAAFFDINAQLRWALIGLIGSVAVLGAVIARFIPTSNRQ